MRVLLLVSILLSNYVVNAQSATVRWGYNRSTVTDNDLREGSSRPKYRGGMMLGVGLEGKPRNDFSLGAELQFVQKGYKLREEFYYTLFYFKEDLDMRVNYLSLPVYFKWFPARQKKGHYLLLGAYGAYATGGRYSYYYKKSQGNTVIEQKRVEDLTLDFDSSIEGNNGQDYSIKRRGDVGVDVGLGVQMVRGMVLETRYSFGLTKLSEASRGEPRNRNFNLGLVFLLPL
ncbi:MAG: PorT family protein [Cyclobacteriaceae bacterium]|nr:PorT family protein [Cyclobacteriaceae bacterium]